MNSDAMQVGESNFHITPGQQISIELAGLSEQICHGNEVREYVRERLSQDREMLLGWENTCGAISELEGFSDEQKEAVFGVCAAFMGLARVATIRRLHNTKVLKRGF